MLGTAEKTEVTRCFHCGDECQSQNIVLDSKFFCCSGCKTVYEILNESSLCDYYSLESNPGNKIKGNTNQDFAYLDDEKIKQSLLRFREGNVSAVTFNIPSIHCSSCIWLLENLHKIHPGVITSTIQFQKKELDVQFDDRISIRELAQLLSSLGYSPLITLNGKEVNNRSVKKSLYYKLGIAGFCFGNIMMLSLPEYLSVFDEFSGDLRTLFTWLNLLLALPVLTYSSSDYYISAYNAIKNRMINIDIPIVLAIIAAFVQSAYEIFTGTGTGFMDSLTGLVFFLLIGKWYQSKTYEALSFDRDYKSYFPLAATKVVKGKETYVQLNELKNGDEILIRNQEIIPADGVIVDGNARIDYSFVTGESVPVPKKAGQQVFAGGKQVGSTIRVLITREVSESYLTQLWNKDSSKKVSHGLLEFTNKVGRYFTVAVLILSVLTYIYWIGKDSGVALYSAVSVLIIFCPCTFALAVPFCFGSAMNILGRNGLFLKNTQTIEKLAENDTIVFDKTGTITLSGESDIELEGELSDEEKILVNSLVRNSTHPLSVMLAGHLNNYDSLLPDFYEELVARGISGRIGENSVKIGSSSFVGAPDGRNAVDSTHTRVYVNINGIVKGCFKFRNKYRDGLKEAINSLRKTFQLHLLSGDNDSEKKYLSRLFNPQRLHFNQTPTQKLEYVKKLNRGNNVLMVGDGLNDAGALINSNCGVSIIENSGSFSPACDAILDASKFSKLPDFLKYSKACLKSVYWSLGISLLYNIIGLFFAVQGLFSPLVAAIIMPLSSLSVVLFVTLLSRLWAKRYGLK